VIPRPATAHMTGNRRPKWPVAAVVAFLVFLGAAGATDAATPASSVLLTGLANRTLTPGRTNPAVTQATIRQTICVVGWTATIRPPSSYTTSLKRQQLVAYGFVDLSTGHYEEDHLIPLELGGAPRDPRNLWPEPYHVKIAGRTDLGAYAKDRLENYLKREVCAGRVTLLRAQYEFRANWVAYWRIAFKVPVPPKAVPVATPTPTAIPTPTTTAAPTPAPTATPAVTPNPYPGATAICNDGTLSYSKSRSGTCSHHGGVRVWL
jgi:hypothetical protein